MTIRGDDEAIEEYKREQKKEDVKQNTTLSHCKNELKKLFGALGRDRTFNLASGGPRDIHFTTRATQQFFNRVYNNAIDDQILAFVRYMPNF